MVECCKFGARDRSPLHGDAAHHCTCHLVLQTLLFMRGALCYRFQYYARLRQAIDAFPVIDCHEHTCGPQAGVREPRAHRLPGGRLRPQRFAGGRLSGLSGSREDMEAFFADQNVATERSGRSLSAFGGRRSTPPTRV